MPAYNSAASSVNIPVHTPGRAIQVWNSELTVHDPSGHHASQQICLHRNEHFGTPISAEIQFSADPGAFVVQLQVADTDDDAHYVTKAIIQGTSPSDLNSSFIGRIEATVIAKFARLYMLSLANGVSVSANFF